MVDAAHEPEVAGVKAAAVRLLARREHSVYELTQKLLQREYDETVIATVIQALEQGGWLSDERFTEAYVNMRRQRGYGPRRIGMELRERGVDDHLAARFLFRAGLDWTAVLQRQYEKKYGNTPVRDYADKAKRMRFLQYRGFDPESIRHCLQQNSKRE